ncbi:small GTP-binding protein domain [Pelomyxa schiedti]|nr:small GTP-binding protein domain [Pelomyxa schiedti]
MDYDEQEELLVKVVVLGDSGVGKSGLLMRFTKNEFSLHLDMTVGVEFETKTIMLDGKAVKLQIWDTAGQERYRSITSVYYRGTAAAILVYDITKRQTFTNIVKWLHDIRTNAEKEIVVMLLGNKTDLVDCREVTTEEAQAYAYTNNLLFFETSALSDINVNTAFTELLKEHLTQQEQRPQPLITSPSNRIILSENYLPSLSAAPEPPPPPKRTCGC